MSEALPPAQRAQRPPRARIRFPAELPISARVGSIIEALERHQIVIVAGATGSGKTTQLPKIALEMGRGGKKQIGVTQPRRIAATSVAARVAEELGCELGHEVGYQIRFEDRSGPDTWVKFMTDGILLAEIQGDRLLSGYDTLIIDEAHERSLTIDFLLGYLERILPERPDLKVVISSATIETERFSQFFGGAPVVQVEGRTFPVEVLYEPPAEDLDLAEAVANAVENVTALDPRGDILAFLPGEREIRETEQALASRQLRHTLVQPLYARLSAGEQAKVFSRIPQRRVILATNVAETSLTIPGIVYVIDAGLARLSRYDARTGTTRLQIEAVSQASADQRKGRCGRVREGICVRLYDEQSFAARPAFTDPEIKRTALAGVILRMKSLRLGEVEDFRFLDPPTPRAISEGYRVLQELGALDDEHQLTPLGRQLAQFPVDPRLARMILAGAEHGCLPQILALAAGLNVQDPRERPRGLEQKVDQLHAKFRDEQSDFVGLLKLWSFVREQEARGTSQLRRACKENFLSFLRVREWGEIYRQLEQVVKEQRLGPPRRGKPDAEKKPDGAAQAEALHLALLSGMLSRVGQWSSEHRVYLGARQTRFVLHPSSGLARKPPAWVMAYELVETAQLFGRMAAKIEPIWLDRVGHHLLKRSYSDPHWSEKSARASVRQHATLFGLPVLRDHSVDYATIAPTRARLMFLEHALVRGEYKSRGAFQNRNRALLAEVARLRDKARQSDMLADDDVLLSFFDRRVPDSVVNGKTFESWREDAEKTQPELLVLALSDVLSAEGALVPEHYPEQLVLHGVQLAASYRFEPSANDDGVTLALPLALLPQLGAGDLDWTIPAWHEPKIAAILAELPRAARRDLGGVAELAARVAPRLTAFSGPLLPALAAAVYELTGVEIPLEAFRVDAIPPYLRFNCQVLDERGRVVAESRDVTALVERHAARARELLRAAAPPQAWQRNGIVSWDFEDLPRFVTRRALGAELRSFPALVDAQSSVKLELFEAEDTALLAHLGGVRRLLMLACKNALTTLGKRAPTPFSRRPGLPAPRAEAEAFRDLWLSRTASEAFELRPGSQAELPRDKAAFQRLLASGSARLTPTFERISTAIAGIKVELDKTWRALDAAGKQPSGSAAVADIRAQVDQLLAADVLEQLESAGLEQYPRYLRAAQARLTRAIFDPRKDASKAAPLLPLWQAFLARRATAQDRVTALRLHFALEELRVATFAPELKPLSPLSIAAAAAAVQALR